MALTMFRFGMKWGSAMPGCEGEPLLLLPESLGSEGDAVQFQLHRTFPCDRSIAY